MSNSFNFDFKGYDVISIINDINTSNNDPYLANRAILKEFDSRRKKRNYNSMNALSEKIFQNNFSINNIKDDIQIIDSMPFEDYFEQIIKSKETPNDEFQNYTPENDLDIGQYIEFVNEYVEPIINPELFEDIYFLTEHIKEQFDDLQSFTIFDINWIGINTLQKFSKISARIDLRDSVNKDDVIKGYFMTKEFLQKIYVHVLLNKTAKARNGHGNKAKIEFVLEKLRQYMNISGDKITVEEIKSFGCFMSHEYDKLIDQLNMQGLLLKTGTREYQILFD
jgi:DNA replicative helicase MCM subunit Mcm2 (Cdc46/Mcm family)